MPQHRINPFSLWINSHDFKEVEDLETPDDMVEVFMKTMNEKVFPTRTIKIFDQDKEFMTDELHKIRRAKAREYRKRKKSPKFLELHQKFIQMRKRNSEKYMREKVETLRQCNPAEFFRKLKAVGKRAGEDTEQVYKLPKHKENNMTPEEAADNIATEFLLLYV